MTGNPDISIEFDNCRGTMHRAPKSTENAKNKEGHNSLCPYGKIILLR